MRAIKVDNNYLTKEGTWVKDINKALLVEPIDNLCPISCVDIRKVLKTKIVLNKDTDKYIHLYFNDKCIPSSGTVLGVSQILNSKNIEEKFSEFVTRKTKVNYEFYIILNSRNKFNLIRRYPTNYPVRISLIDGQFKINGGIADYDSKLELLQSMSELMGYTLLCVDTYKEVKELTYE